MIFDILSCFVTDNYNLDIESTPTGNRKGKNIVSEAFLNTYFSLQDRPLQAPGLHRHPSKKFESNA